MIKLKKRSQLKQVAAQSGGAPFTYEHRGVHEAVARIGQNNVTPAAMHAALHELSKEHADKAVIGNVLEAFMGTDDALWCTIVMDDERSLLLTRAVFRYGLNQRYALRPFIACRVLGTPG